jgi:hypothetical protein
MVSHIDDDHINGIIELTADLIDLGEQGQPQPFEILTLWHNSFDDMLGNGDFEMFSELSEAAVSAASTSPVLRLASADDRLAAVLANVPQGRELRRNAGALSLLPANAPFKGLVMAKDAAPVLDWDGIKMTVIHPNERRITALHKLWEKALETAKEKGDPSVLEAAYLDTSVANLSSIVVLLELGGKTMLLTGDARGDDIVAGLQRAGLLGEADDDSFSVDLLKVPHHGSDRNVSTRFFRQVRAKHYVISGDGGHDNPDIATLKMIADARDDNAFTLHLTNRTGKKNIGPKLKAHFDAEKASGRKYKVVFRAADALSMQVDLLDEVDY